MLEIRETSRFNKSWKCALFRRLLWDFCILQQGTGEWLFKKKTWRVVVRAIKKKKQILEKLQHLERFYEKNRKDVTYMTHIQKKYIKIFKPGIYLQVADMISYVMNPRWILHQKTWYNMNMIGKRGTQRKRFKTML